MKRFNYLNRDKKGLLAEIVLPIIVLIFGFGVSSFTFINEKPSLLYGLNFYPNQNLIYSGDDSNALF